MNISNQTEKFGASTKRITTWRGMQVGFNKSKTKFFVIDELLTKDAAQYDSNGGRILTGRALELDEYEVGSLLNCWRAGKAQWASEHGIKVSKI